MTYADTDTPKAERPKDDAAIVARARACMDDAQSADLHNREQARDDLRWLAGEQWTQAEKDAREGRPTITVNLLAQFPRQVTGDIRRMNPAVNVLAADGDASAEVAEVIEGLVRHIEQASDASAVYEGAAESAAQCGIGNFRVLTDYEDEDGFDQTIRIRRIHDPFAVHWDPAAKEATREDAEWCLITEEMEAEDFEAAYPGKSAQDVANDTGAEAVYWRRDKVVVVAEFFWKDYENATLYLLDDGSVTDKKPAGNRYVRKRAVQRCKVMWAKVSGTDVLEGPREFPSKHIPVVAVCGEELHIDGRVVRNSVIRFAKDPQKLYNYWTSAQTEVIALQPKAPYLVTPKQVAGLEEHWNEANDANVPYLPYTPDEKAPPPQRAQPPVPSVAMMQEVAKAREDIKGTTGIYSAALGDRSNESSGVAIRQRQTESDVSTSIYSDNMGKAIGHCGRILVDMIPRIYDTPRTVRIVGKDDVEKLLDVNAEQPDPQNPGAMVPTNVLTVGKYDIRVTVGPNYSTRRQEVSEAMGQFMQAMGPQVGLAIADLYVKAQEWPNSDEIADRLKGMLPPGAIKPEEMSPEEQQAAQQAMQKAAQQEQMQQAAFQLEMREKAASAAEKEARAMVAVADAETARMQAMQTDSGPAPQDPRLLMLELQEKAAAIQETLERVGLIAAQTRLADAKAMQSTVQALTPPPPPQAPRVGASPAN